MAIDLSRPDHVGGALLKYLAGHLGVADIDFAQPLRQIAGGWRTRIYAFRLRGDGLDSAWEAPLVLRVLPGADRGPQMQREAAIQRFVVERRYPAPRLLAVEATADALGAPFVVMERAPGAPMSRRTAARNLITVYRLAEAFADAHVALHRLPVEGCPLPSEGFSVDRRLASYREWMDRSKELGEAFAWLEAHKVAVIPEEISICHNNFHPVNIIVDSSYRVSVIDWSNFDLGDRHEDVADALVLMRTAPLGERTRPRRLFSRVSRGLFLWRYLHRYSQQLPVDPERLRYWEALRALVQWGVRSAFEPSPSEWLAVQPNDAALHVVAEHRANLCRYFWQRVRE